eukprot:TRINITY_DN61194_c0_g1_i1.p1 TRINITY_DN61194_c0_g1~~TRINITY_DN61194_c0_g1_i1.p1  ORF type:complete len:619 (+),score=173.89 TRINITY_DN61194_c0_g1_i1:83-1939(+)
MVSVEAELRQELINQEALREALENDLKQSAQLGHSLLLKNEELEQELQQKKVGFLSSPATSQPPSRRQSRQSRRSSTVPHAYFEVGRSSIFSEGTQSDEDQSSTVRPAAAKRRARGGKTLLVEELMNMNQALEEDFKHLRAENERMKEEKEDQEDDSSDEGPDLRKESERLHASVLDLESQLQAQLQISSAQASKIRALEADLEMKKAEVEETRALANDSEKKAVQITSLKEALQESLDIANEERGKTVKLLERSETRTEELTHELEEQTLLRGKDRRKSRFMPTACEDVLRTAALQASLADELEDPDLKSDEDDQAEASERVLALQTELTKAEADASERESALKTELTAAKAEASERESALKMELTTATAEVSHHESALRTKLTKAEAEASKRESALKTELAKAEAEASQRESALQTELSKAEASQHESSSKTKSSEAEAEASERELVLKTKLSTAEAEASERESALKTKLSMAEAEASERESALKTELSAAEASERESALKTELAKAKAEASELESALRTELTAAEAGTWERALDLQNELFASEAQLSTALAENAKLCEHLRRLTEASSSLPEPPEPSWWDQVMASIACARTAKPNTTNTPSSRGPVKLAAANQDD